jgi:hypothetical protein
MTAAETDWRVSAATLDRVVFEHPRDGTQMLALERRATLGSKPGPDGTLVRAQPFGGAVRIRDTAALRDVVGEIRFDSERSRVEQDFRILISPKEWEAVRQFCLRHLADDDDPILEAGPRRELAEEFADALQVQLEPGQYYYRPVGFAVENEPSRTDNVYAYGCPTVRVYRIFEVEIVDRMLCAELLASSARYGTEDLQALARMDADRGGKGWATTVLTLPLDRVVGAYLALPIEKRYANMEVEGHAFDASVGAILPGVEVPEFERIL